MRQRKRRPHAAVDGSVSIDEDDHIERSIKDTPSISNKAKPLATHQEVRAESKSPQAITFHVTKYVILRLVGFVYLIAFLGAYNQNRGLMGTHGLMPVQPYMDQLRQRYDSRLEGFLAKRTV